MATRSVFSPAPIILVLMVITLVPAGPGFAQSETGRWTAGLRAGGNLWFNDYNARVVGMGAELMWRYGISREFSAGLLLGYEELKSDQDPPTSGAYLKLQAIPVSVVGWFHLAPDKPFNPYLYIGAGTLIYKRTIGGTVNVAGGGFKNSIHVPAGIGIESFTSRDVSIAADLGYRIADDYADGLKTGRISVYATAKVGVNIYFGASASEKEELARLEARRLKELSDAEAGRVKDSVDAAAQRIKDSTGAEARLIRDSTEAEARRLKDSTEAEARRLKDSTEAEAQRLADLNAHRPADTVVVLERGTTVVLRGITFESGKATLSTGSEATLRSALTALRTSPDVSVLIVGHTDKAGRAAYNRILSLRRAQTVKTWLVRKGIASRRLTVAGKGFDEPIDDNSTPGGRANNRRIEFRVLN